MSQALKPAPRPSGAQPRRAGLFGGVVDGVRKLLASEPETAAQPEAVRTAAPASHAPSPPVPNPHLAAGRFSLLGLTQIREELGPRWPQVVEKVHAVAEATINRHLLKGDVFERCSDDSYLVLFASLGKEQADFKCRVISKEIARHLLGTDSTMLASLETVRADVPREALASGDVEEVLERALAQGVRTTTTRADVQAEAGDTVSEVLFLRRAGPAKVAGESDPIDQYEQELASPSSSPLVSEVLHATAGPQWRPIKRFTLAAVADAPQDGAGQFEPLLNRPRALEEEGAPPDGGDQAVVWRYSPIWDFKLSTLIRFRLSASAGGRWVHPYSGNHPDASEAALFENDVRAVSKAMSDLELLASRGRRLPIVCPVHFSSVSLESRRALLFHELRKGPPQSSRLLVLEVVRPPQALWARGFLDIADAFRRSGFSVGMCLPVDRLAEIDSIAPHVQALTTEAPQGEVIEKVKIEQLNAFVRRTRAKGIDASVYGLRTRSMVMAALGGGFRFLSGEAVHESAETLDNALRFEALDLYVER